MKKLLTLILALALAFTVAIPSLAVDYEVTSLTAGGTTSNVTFSGTTEDGVLAVMVEILDSEDNTIIMRSFPVEANTFSDSITGLSLTAGATYTLRAADYGGGLWTETEFTVPASPSPGGTPSSITVPVSSDEGNVSVSATVSGGTASVTVTDSQLSDIISGSETTGTVTVDVSALDDVDSAKIPAKVVGTVYGAADGLEVKLPTGSVKLDKTALGSIPDGQDVVISAEEVDSSALTAEHKSILGEQADNAVIIDVSVLVNSKKVTDFAGGKVTVSVPYTPKEGEDMSKLTVWYLKDDGSIEPTSGSYNPATGCMEFTTMHLSEYAIVNFPFTDVAESAWYYADVAYVRNNKLFSGTGDDMFSPTTPMTRGMLVTVLYRLEGEPAVTGTNPFDDVASGKYYENAVTWAAANKIVDGYGDGKFDPEAPITREQMAAILYRYEQFKGGGFTGAWMFPLNFPDADNVSDWAYEAMCWCTMNGIIGGNSDGTLVPKSNAERCQVAAILHRFCESNEK